MTSGGTAPGSSRADRSWTVDSVAETVGVTALASAGLLVAGLGYTSAYLSAWRVPLSAVHLDPLTAALRSDAAIYDAILIVAVAAGASWALDRLARPDRPGWAVAILVLAVLTAAAAAGALIVWGVGIAILAGLAIALGRERGWLPGWRMVAAFALGALLSGYATGLSVGMAVRDREARQTPVVLTTALPVGGLSGGVQDGDAWRYEDLYLVYRDPTAVYVSRAGSGAVAWMIAEFNLRSLAIGRSR